MTHIKINASCFGFGRGFSEHEVLAVGSEPGAACVTREQARELILAGRAHPHVAEEAPTPAPARPLSVETAEAAPTTEAAAGRPARARKGR